MKKFIQIFLMVQSSLISCQGTTLSDLKKDVSSLPEQVYSNNADWSDPNYVHFYTSSQKTWMQKILQYVGMQSNSALSIETVETLLKEVLEQRWWYASQLEDIKKGIFWSGHVVAKPGTKFVIWGDLFGAVHSLIRSLEYWYANGIIDETLKIVNPDYYFVFLGNAINRSPYSLETLYVLLSLMKRNPDQVLYLCGKYESVEYWQNLNIKRQIKVMYHNNAEKVAQLEHRLNAFFVSLPIGLFITQNDSTRMLVCLSNEIPNYYLDATTANDFFSRTSDSIKFVPVTKSEIEQVPLTAIVKGREVLKTAVNQSGLTLELPYRKATVWSVLSCPSTLYQRFADFYQDSFVQLTMKESVDQATIQLISQHIHNKNGFSAGPQFDLVTGQRVRDVALQHEVHLIGSTMPLSDSSSIEGESVKRGIMLPIDQCNAQNCLNHRYIRLIVLDDQYIPLQALGNVKNFIHNYGIKTLLSPLGSSTFSAYLTLIRSNQITVLFPITGPSSLRDPSIHNVINWRPSFDAEVRVLLDYMITKKTMRKCALFYQDDAYGLSALNAAHAFLKSKGNVTWIDIPHKQIDVNLSSAAEIIRKERPDSIGLFALPGATKKLFDFLGAEGLLGKKIFGISGMEDKDFRQYTSSRGIEVILSEVVPDPSTSDLDIVRQYRDLFDANNAPYDVLSLEAYIGVCLYIDALKILGNNATQAAVIKYFESFKDVVYKGLKMSFNLNDRSLSSSVWISSDDQWKEYSVALTQ